MNKADAKQIAQNLCLEKGWPWIEPIEVRWGLFYFTIRTNAQSRGANVYIRIRKRDGTITYAGIAPY
jgi:hypothetical protein